MEELVMESGPLDPLTIEQDGVIGAGEAIALATSQSLLVRMVTFGCEFAMIVGGVVPYVPQYISIRSSGNTKGFSLYVCLALITANILRILFWYVKKYYYLITKSANAFHLAYANISSLSGLVATMKFHFSFRACKYIVFDHWPFAEDFSYHIFFSSLMNIAMFALIHLCVHVNSQDRIAGQYKEHVFTGK